LGESDAVAFQMDVTGVHATSTNAITATFDQQVNGANWATGFTTLVVTATGTLTASGVLNLPVGAMANLRLQKIASALYGSNTTISVYSNKKPQ
jgi:hypothetical protein